MALNIDKMPRNGVYEWIFQRTTNLLIVIYGLIVASHFLSEATADYGTMVALFNQGWFKLFNLLMIVIACLNSVLAGWQIAGDYLNKHSELNKLFMWVCTIVTFVYLVFGVSLLV
jgi:succinate dehydrogenase / fumarate reductase, membrane anchor subunit